LLLYTHRLPSLLFIMLVAVSEVELFLVEPEVKSQWTVLVGYMSYYLNKC